MKDQIYLEEDRNSSEGCIRKYLVPLSPSLEAEQFSNLTMGVCTNRRTI